MQVGNREPVIRTKTTPPQSTSGLERELVELLLGSLHCLHSSIERSQNNMASSNPSLCCPFLHEHKEKLEKHSWERSTLQCLSTKKRISPFSTTTTTELHILPPVSSLQVQKFPSPSPHNHPVTRGGWHELKKHDWSDLERWQHRVPRSVVEMLATQPATTMFTKGSRLLTAELVLLSNK